MATGRYWLAAILAFLLVAGTTAAGWHSARTVRRAAHQAVPPPLAAQAPGSERPSPGPRAAPEAAASGSAAPSSGARRSCPAAASACVDLSDHLTWLQYHGRITYGPVRMEPGAPGAQHATPRGTFQVLWKAGPN